MLQVLEAFLYFASFFPTSPDLTPHPFRLLLQLWIVLQSTSFPLPRWLLPFMNPQRSSAAATGTSSSSGFSGHWFPQDSGCCKIQHGSIPGNRALQKTSTSSARMPWDWKRSPLLSTKTHFQENSGNFWKSQGPTRVHHFIWQCYWTWKWSCLGYGCLFVIFAGLYAKWYQ